MNFLKNFNKLEQYNLNDILNNNLFELKNKKFFKFRSKWLLERCEKNDHLKFISLLVILYETSKKDFHNIYPYETACVRKETIKTLIKAYFHHYRYGDLSLISKTLNYMFEINYFDEPFIKLLTNKYQNNELDLFYEKKELIKIFKRFKYIPDKKFLNMPQLGIHNKIVISNYLVNSVLIEK